MLGTWLSDIESFEAINQDAGTRDLVLRMAAMSRAGTLGGFLDGLDRDASLDDDTKGTLQELASDRSFLLAVEDYCRRTIVHH